MIQGHVRRLAGEGFRDPESIHISRDPGWNRKCTWSKFIVDCAQDAGFSSEFKFDLSKRKVGRRQHHALSSQNMKSRAQQAMGMFDQKQGTWTTHRYFPRLQFTALGDADDASWKKIGKRQSIL